jgi:hypothetical protein
MFEEAKTVVSDIKSLKKKIADRSVKSSVKIAGIYSDYDDRVSKAELTLAKSLDSHAMDIESAARELSNLGESITAASSDDTAETKSEGAHLGKVDAT